MIFLFTAPCLLKADEVPGGDQDFMKALNSIKNPFEDGIPKPVPVYVPPPPVVVPKPVVFIPKPKPRPLPVKLPVLHLQGVMVGEEMHEAIIDGQEVSLLESIKGAKLISVSKEGVGLVFKGKKFFLKVD